MSRLPWGAKLGSFTLKSVIRDHVFIGMLSRGIIGFCSCVFCRVEDAKF